MKLVIDFVITLFLVLCNEFPNIGLHRANDVRLVDVFLERNLFLLKRICKSQVGEELEVDEFEEGHVEFGEGSHYFVVDVERHSLVEFERLDPSNWLSHDFDTIIDPLDREEGLGKALTDRAVEYKVSIQTGTVLYDFFGDFKCQMLRQLSV